MGYYSAWTLYCINEIMFYEVYIFNFILCLVKKYNCRIFLFLTYGYQKFKYIVLKVYQIKEFKV